MDIHVKKTIPITFDMVVKAYAKVKRGGKAVGIDNESWEIFEQKGIEKSLYVIWNRMASGSYFPQPVREVEILKKDGRKRKLGIPTIRDRIAQQVIKMYMEERIDKRFHKSSYGYRPMKSSKQALQEVRQNCFKLDWVVDLDISNFFDEIDHNLMMKAVKAILPEKWVSMYIERWLEMKVVKSDGSIEERNGRGTPQGGVISPILANLFLHYGLDKWLEINFPQTHFVRYADDVIVHCQTKEEAEGMLEAIQARLYEIGLRTNERKTKIVYCKDYRRKLKQKQVQFDFLGFSYQPTPSKNKITKGMFTTFTPEISKENKKRIRDSIKETVNWRNTTQAIDTIALKLNSKLRGWINYFSMFGKRELRKTLLYLEWKLVYWIQRKHKKGLRWSVNHLDAIKRKNPTLFYHWETNYCYYLLKK